MVILLASDPVRNAENFIRPSHGNHRYEYPQHNERNPHRRQSRCKNRVSPPILPGQVTAFNSG
jgi:hypothetical protein